MLVTLIPRTPNPALRTRFQTGSYTVAKNQLKLLDLSGGLAFVDTDLSFDFEGLLFDFRQLPGSPGSNASSVA